MRAAYWAFVFVIAGLVSVFAASNRATVILALWPLPFVAQAPLYLVVLVALAFGCAIGAVAAWIKGHRRRRQLRQCRRQNEALARELAAARTQLANPTEPSRTALLP